MLGKQLKKEERKYLPEFVYGGIDGAITTFSVVAGSVGASLSSTIILILGFADLFAGGFSMAVSNYLSTKSLAELHIRHRDYKEIQRLGAHPLKNGLATFVSFITVGIIPLMSFVGAALFPLLQHYQFTASYALTALALVMVGAIKGLVVKKHPVRSAAETLLIGSIAAGLAYLVGAILRGVV